MPKALSLCGNRIQRRAGLCWGACGGALSFCLLFSFSGLVPGHYPQFKRDPAWGQTGYLSSSDESVTKVVTKAEGYRGDAGVMAGLITALLRPVALPLGRFAAGVLCVRAGERLANATVCRFCGCF